MIDYVRLVNVFAMYFYFECVQMCSNVYPTPFDGILTSSPQLLSPEHQGDPETFCSFFTGFGICVTTTTSRYLQSGRISSTTFFNWVLYTNSSFLSKIKHFWTCSSQWCRIVVSKSRISVSEIVNDSTLRCKVEGRRCHIWLS